jgi:hypothetical protein
LDSRRNDEAWNFNEARDPTRYIAEAFVNISSTTSSLGFVDEIPYCSIGGTNTPKGH